MVHLVIAIKFAVWQVHLHYIAPGDAPRNMTLISTNSILKHSEINVSMGQSHGKTHTHLYHH